MTFLNKTKFTKPVATTEAAETTEKKSKLGKPLGGLKKESLGATKPTSTLGGPKSLLKKKPEPKEIVLSEETVKEAQIEKMVKPEEKIASPKPTLGKKSLISKKKDVAKEVKPIEATKITIKDKDDNVVLEIDHQKDFENKEDMSMEALCGQESEEIDVTHCPDDDEVIKFEEAAPKEVELEVKEEKKTTKKKTTRKTTSKKKDEVKVEQQVVKALEVDETKRISLEEMDSIMRPIVAPTTEMWEQEKKDVLEALNTIKVEQDMNMSQVKSCLSELDELKFEILPKHHDAETMFNGTKQNYDTVKAIAIANGSGGNAEARKAEGILACKNFVTPTGEVVDLHQYMLLIEERQKFYEKVSDGVNFKKYSLVNYNNAIKAEKEGK